MRNMSIIHIEDEYEEFLSLVMAVATAMEDYLIETRGTLLQTKTRLKYKSEDEQKSWIVYEITVEQLHDLKVRYIYLKGPTIPIEVEQYFFQDRVFIVDVLRPVPKQTQLGITVHDSLASVRKYTDSMDNVVLFTAHQGTGLDTPDPHFPRKISKASESDLETFLGERLVRCLDG